MASDKNKKLLNIAVWLAQSLLAAFFLMAGFMKSTSPVDQLHQNLIWTKDVPLWLVRFIGISELLGVVGLLIPSVFRIKPILTPVAAAAFILLMVLAILYYISRGEANIIGMHFVIIFLASFIAWGRFKKVPIHPRP